MASLPIGLQLYSVREDCKKDLPGTLAAVAAMGYRGVEFAGLYDHAAAEVKRMLDDLGLKCCGTHTRLDTILGDELARTAELNLALGNPYLIVPSLGKERTESADAWKKTADLFNAQSAKARALGCWIGHHTHAVDLKEQGGRRGWDIFLSATVADVVMQVDVGNVLAGGGDPVDFLRRYPGRALTVHLKEYDSANDKTLIGQGRVDWLGVLAACREFGGTKWYIVEQESYPFPPLESARRSLDNLRALPV